MQLHVITGLDLGVKGSALWQVEPELEFIGEFEGALLALEVGLEVDGAFLTLGVEFEGVEFVVDEILGEEGIGLFGEVGPGVDLDAFGFGHGYQLNKYAN